MLRVVGRWPQDCRKERSDFVLGDRPKTACSLCSPLMWFCFGSGLVAGLGVLYQERLGLAFFEDLRYDIGGE